ncbi:MAG: hypothetical protein ABUT39_10015 [Acidobacteriota bacterium]
MPAYHAKALHLDASIVVGMRGAGKSWWTAVLASPKHRRFVSEQLQHSALSRVNAKVGFGLADTEVDFPRAETVVSLLDKGTDPIAIWLTVVLRHAMSEIGQGKSFPEGSWPDRVRWVVEHRDEVNAKLTECDAELAKRGQVLLVLFDAFDRLSNDWSKARRLSSAALQLGLNLRSRSAVRLKFFIRPDLEEDPETWGFPDSSKLRHSKVDLAWSSTDLYGLVFMQLSNANETDGFAAEFRQEIEKEFSLQWEKRDNVYILPSTLTRNANLQQKVVEGLADRYMGGGPKRGTTYTWVPLHLADAAGKISPRSYLLAFKGAAEHTDKDHPDHQRALHFSAIQEGVVKASEIRVQEIAEDYPWVTPLLEAASGAVVPITAEELSKRWTPDCIRRMRRATASKLPPRRFTSDPLRQGNTDILIDDLVELAVLYRTKDRRLNIPDIFRVGFGIKRKGGVKPPR